ncbi:MAG: MBL fold metallo-hydrolase [Acidobacteriota bacterium]
MKLTFLGTGTSVGVPVIGCKCKVCRSPDQRNHRLRPSVLLELNGNNILIDTSTDLRQQALRYGINRIDAILFTHAHADHIFGLDEMRIYNSLQRSAIPCYGNRPTINSLREIFKYIFAASPDSKGVPKITTHIVEGKFSLFGQEICPIEVYHGKSKILGYRVGSLAYITDCSRIEEDSLLLLQSLNIFILGTLRYRPHPAHLSLSQALEVVARVHSRRTYLTHLSHDFEYTKVSRELPPDIHLAYDGLELVSD